MDKNCHKNIRTHPSIHRNFLHVKNQKVKIPEGIYFLELLEKKVRIWQQVFPSRNMFTSYF